ncbi:MAG: hypothetical protein K2J88_03960 [Oscillospiraceae bacterium]|nr:hypothetical protein [Oscillospiraceae bacterium]
MGYYLKTGDTDAENYIYENFVEILKILIQNDNLNVINKIMKHDKLFAVAKQNSEVMQLLNKRLL